MEINLENNLYIGDQNSCFYGLKDGWVAIHACKSPCHQRVLGYKGSLLQNHPNYIIKELESHLFLNMVDMNIPWDPKFASPMIIKSMEFIQKNINKKVLIHCNLGFSRSPAIALVYLAKFVRKIPNDSYESAKSAFLIIYPNYNPGNGIEIYLRKNWNNLFQKGY